MNTRVNLSWGEGELDIGASLSKVGFSEDAEAREAYEQGTTGSVLTKLPQHLLSWPREGSHVT